MSNAASPDQIAHVRLCILMGQEMDEAMHGIEHSHAFKMAFQGMVPVLKSNKSTSGACLKLVVPPPAHAPHAVQMDLGLGIFFAHPFHAAAFEQSLIALINVALKDVIHPSDAELPDDDPSIRDYFVTIDGGRDGWCSPNPRTGRWERYRTYRLMLGRSGEKAQEVTLAEACAAYSKRPGANPTPEESAALTRLSKQPVMALLSIVEEVPLV